MCNEYFLSSLWVVPLLNNVSYLIIRAYIQLTSMFGIVTRAAL